MPETLAAIADAPGVLQFSVNANGVPTRAGADGAERLWLVGRIMCGAPAGLPDGAGGDGTLITGTAAVVTTPTSVFGVISPDSVGGSGLAFAAPRAALRAVGDGEVGLVSRRPAAIDLEHADWVMRIESVTGVDNGRSASGSETQFLVALGGTPAVSMGSTGQGTLAPTIRRYLPQLATVAAVFLIGIVGIISAAVWPIVVR
jgi:hypothetical protein